MHPGCPPPVLPQVWIAQLDKQDPFNLGNAAMLEPVEPALCRMESEALIALHHPLASVRLPALQLLITARSLGRALTASHARTVATISGELQRKAEAAAVQLRKHDLEAAEEEAGQLASVRSAGTARPGQRGGAQSARSSARGGGGGGAGGGDGGGSPCGTGRSGAASEMSDTIAMEELQQVNDALKEEAEARAHVPPPAVGVRVADVFEEQWGAIRAGALRRLLISDGDHVLQADSYRLPTDLSLRRMAEAEHSIMWTYVMASATHTALDAGCVRMARYTRRALRLRLRALPALAKMHRERPDGLFAYMHISWGSLVLACSGLPTSRFGRGSISFAEVQRRIAASAPPRRKGQRGGGPGPSQPHRPLERKPKHIKRGLTGGHALQAP